MPLWEVNDEINIEMVRWLVMRATFNDGVIEDHVIGNYSNGDGRVSSKIINFDKEERIATTKSGKKYHLNNDKLETNNNAYYVWYCWKKINNVVSYKNVTENYL